MSKTLFYLTLHGTEAGQVVIGIHMPRIQPNGLFKAPLGRREILLMNVYDPQIVECIHVTRIQPEGFLIESLGPLETTALMKSPGTVIEGLCIVNSFWLSW